jgi:rifampin ADP-ribosylating transferase
MSYRSKDPFKVVGELAAWQGHITEQVNPMKDGMAKLKAKGIEAMEDPMKIQTCDVQNL